MTNKEAIKILEVAKAEVEWTAPLEYQDAFDTAIEALKNSVPYEVYERAVIERDMQWNSELGEETRKDLQPTCNQLATDCISRQAAIDAILDVTGNSSVRELYEHVQEHGLSDMWSGGVNAAIDIIIAMPSAQTKQQWILCSERLPDKEGMYLVTDEAGGISGIICDAFFYCDDGKPTWLLSQSAKAWMPLPEPYREGEG